MNQIKDIDNNEILFWKVYHNLYIRNYIFHQIKTMDITFYKHTICNDCIDSRIPFKYFKELKLLISREQWSLLKYKLQFNDELIIDRNSLYEFFRNCQDDTTISLFLNTRSNEIISILGSIENVKLLIHQFSNCSILKYFLSLESKPLLHDMGIHTEKFGIDIGLVESKELQWINEWIKHPYNIIRFYIDHSKTDEHYQYLIQLIKEFEISNIGKPFIDDCFYDMAISNNNHKLVSLLIQNNIKPSNSNTIENQISVLNYLFSKKNTKSGDNHLEIELFIKNNDIIKQQQQQQQGDICNFISVSEVPLLNLCIENNNYQFAKILIQKYKLLPNLQDSMIAINTSMYGYELLNLFFKDGFNCNLIKKDPSEYRILFEIINKHSLVRNSLIQLILDSNILQEVDTTTNNRVISFSMFSNITDENLQVKLAEMKLIDIVNENELKIIIDNKLRDPNSSIKGYLVLGDQYSVSILSNETNQLAYSSIRTLFLISMLENDNFETIKKKTVGIHSDSIVAKQMVETILYYYSVRPKLSNNLNSILQNGDYSTVKWFINISQHSFIPLLPIKQQIIENPPIQSFIYKNLSFNDKIEFLKECSKSIQINDKCYNGGTIDSLIQSFYPFNDCEFSNLEEVISLFDSLKYASLSSLYLIVKCYLYEKVIPNCDIDELLKTNSTPQPIAERTISGQTFWSSLSINNTNYFKESELSDIQSNVDINQLNPCLQFVTVDDNVLEVLFSFCLLKSKFKELAIKHNIISSSLQPFITKIQYGYGGWRGVDYNRCEKILKFILSNYKELSQFIESLYLVQLLESLILFKYPIKIIKILFQILNQDEDNDSITSKLSHKVVDLILINNENDEYYRELLKLSFINHKLIIWDNNLISPLSFTSIINFTISPHEGTITNLFKQYKLNKNFKNSTSNSNDIDRGSNNKRSSSVKNVRREVGPIIKTSELSPVSNMISIFGIDGNKNNDSVKTDINIKQSNIFSFDSFEKYLRSIPLPTWTTSPPLVRQYDIYNLIKSGRIYAAYDILVENKGNWSHFKFTSQQTIKILKYCEMDVIEQFSRFFNSIDFTLEECNNRIDVYQFLNTIK